MTPRLTVSPGQVTARLGDSVTMRCQPLGQGPFQIEWQKVGGILPRGVREFDGVLEIQQVTAADAGRYRCIATNNAGSSEGYATLNVAGEKLFRVELSCHGATGTMKPSCVCFPKLLFVSVSQLKVGFI